MGIMWICEERETDRQRAEHIVEDNWKIVIVQQIKFSKKGYIRIRKKLKLIQSKQIYGIYK